MKTMTCNDLGGACNLEFHAETFEEMAILSQAHGKEMMEQGEPAHLEAMNKMVNLMENPEEMKKWMDSKRKMFDDLPENQ